MGVGVAAGMCSVSNAAQVTATRPPRRSARLMNRLDLPARPRILVVTLAPTWRCAADHAADPQLAARMAGSARLKRWSSPIPPAFLHGNPDLDEVVTIPPQPSAVQTLRLGARLFRRYDLAISTQSGDRPTGFAIVAGRVRVAPVPANFNGRVKRALLHRSIAVTPGLHRVEEMLRLADALGIARVPELVCPRVAETGERPAGPYAVIHAAPMFRYKQWTIAAGASLQARLPRAGST